MQHLIVSELERVRQQLAAVRAAPDLTHWRLDDVNLQLADQSRRMEAVREERILRADAMNSRFDKLHEGPRNLAMAAARRVEQERWERRVGEVAREVLGLTQKVA